MEGTAHVATAAFGCPAKAKPSGPDHRSVVLSGTPCLTRRVHLFNSHSPLCRWNFLASFA